MLIRQQFFSILLSYRYLSRRTVQARQRSWSLQLIDRTHMREG